MKEKIIERLIELGFEQFSNKPKRQMFTNYTPDSYVDFFLFVNCFVVKHELRSSNFGAEARFPIDTDIDKALAYVEQKAKEIKKEVEAGII